MRCVVLTSSHEKVFSSGANLAGFGADVPLIHKHLGTEHFPRLFRLLGLRYQPVEMHSAWLAVNHRRKEQFLAALEFLDTVLEPRLKRVLLPVPLAPLDFHPDR